MKSHITLFPDTFETQPTITLDVLTENLLNILLIRLHTINSQGHIEHIPSEDACCKILVHVITLLSSVKKPMGITVISTFYACGEKCHNSFFQDISEQHVLFHLQTKEC
jgi:hypothetical protein